MRNNTAIERGLRRCLIGTVVCSVLMLCGILLFGKYNPNDHNTVKFLVASILMIVGGIVSLIIFALTGEAIADRRDEHLGLPFLLP